MATEGSGELAQLVQLIQLLYAPTTSHLEQPALQLRLQAVQASDAAWSVIDPLLAHADANVRFFAASTLLQKLSRAWATLPDAAHQQLKSSLLSWLARSAALAYPQAGAGRPGERMVMRKLAAAATSLSLQLAGWDDWLLEVVMRVAAGDSASGGAPLREAVLDVLSVAIEQVNRAELAGPKRAAYFATLASSIPHVVSTLASSLSSSSAPQATAALACFAEFLAAGQLAHTELAVLYPLIVPLLSRAETAVEACAAVQEITERSSGVTGGAGVTRFMSRARTEELVATWCASDFVKECIAEAVQTGEASDEALAVMRLLSALGEHFLTFLFSTVPYASPVLPLALFSPATLHLLQLILAITLFPGHSLEAYDINEMPTGVWLALQEECSDAGLVSGEGDGREGRDGREADWATVQGVFEALATGLRTRAEWPVPAVVDAWPKDMVEEFNVYRRTAVADTLLYPYYILRDSLLGDLVSTAAAQIPDALQGRDEPLEATLFALYSVQEAVSSDEHVYLPHLFSSSILGSLPRPPSSVRLRSTALRLVGSYSAWFATQPGACLEAVQFVMQGLGELTLAPTAARALVSLCSDCRRAFIPHIGSFVQSLAGLEGQLEDAEFVKLLESVASVVQALPADEKVDAVLAIATPVIGKLLVALEGQPTVDARERCLQQLSYLTACARGLADPDSDLFDLDASFDDFQQLREGAGRMLSDMRIVAMRAELGRAVEVAARLWASDIEVVQALADFIKRSTSDSLPSALALDAFSLLQLATSALQHTVSPVWLSIAASLLARLARDESDHDMSDAAVARLAQPVETGMGAMLALLVDLRAMNDNPDIVQAFLSLCLAVVRHFPRIFVVLPRHLDAVLTLAEQGLGLQESFSLKANIELLIAIVQQTRMASVSSDTFRITLLPHILSIVEALLAAIAGGVPRSQLVPLSELLHACLLRFQDETRVALAELLCRPDWPTQRATAEVKTGFSRAVINARTGKAVRTAVSEFALVCRGLAGTAYASRPFGDL